jgi:putative intracellular protease/amidase
MTVSERHLAHLAIYDSLADWEYGYLLAELRTGRFTGTPYEIRTVGESGDAIQTMGGLRLTADLRLDELVPADSDLLILPGAGIWDDGGGESFARVAAAFLAAGVPVAAICGATAGLARFGLLDDRRHTSAAPEYLAATGYRGGELYVDSRAVADRGLVTAGPQSPVQFAAVTLGLLGLMSSDQQEAYVGVFGDADPAAYPALVGAAAV